MITQHLDLRADLFLRDQSAWWRMDVADQQVESVVAAVSADPRTLEEFQHALLRFFSPACVPPVRASNPPAAWTSLDTSRHRAIIDLSRQVIVSSWAPPRLPRRATTWNVQGAVAPQIPYSIPSDWVWQSAQERASNAFDDTNIAQLADGNWQEQLYGQPLQALLLATARTTTSGFDVESTQALARIDSELITDAIDLTRDIHQRLRQQMVDWLNEPTPELGSSTRRTFLVRDALKVDRDLEDRAEQWTLLGECPSAIAETTTCRLYHGPGPIEATLYVDLVRHLLLRVYRHTTLDQEVTQPMIEGWLHHWFTTVDATFPGFSARTIIESERQRIPLRIPDSYRMVDCDCPLCRLAAADRPSFEYLTVDDFSLRFDFPKFWSTQDEVDWFHPNSCDADNPEPDWEDGDEVEFERSSAGMAMSDSEDELFSEADTMFVGDANDGAQGQTEASRDLPSGSPYARSGRRNQLDEKLWKNVFLAPWDGPIPLGVRVFAIAACSGELVEDLKHRTARRPLIDLVLQQVDRLTTAMQAEQPDYILESIANRFCEALDDVEREHAELGPKIHDLQSRVVGFVAS